MGMGSGRGRGWLLQHSKVRGVVETERKMNPITLRTLVTAMSAFVMCQTVMLEVGALDIVGWWWANNEAMGMGGNHGTMGRWSWVATVERRFMVIAGARRTIIHTDSLGTAPCFLISARSCRQ